MQFCMDFIQENIKIWEDQKSRRETGGEGAKCVPVPAKQAARFVNCQQPYVDDEEESHRVENSDRNDSNDYEEGMASCPFVLSPNTVEPLHSSPKSIAGKARNIRPVGCQCCIQ